MINNPQRPNVKVRESKSRDYLIVSDDQGQRIIVPTYLVKHTLGVPYTKKDGTHKTAEQIEHEKISAKIAYVEAVTNAEAEA